MKPLNWIDIVMAITAPSLVIAGSVYLNGAVATLIVVASVLCAIAGMMYIVTRK